MNVAREVANGAVWWSAVSRVSITTSVAPALTTRDSRWTVDISVGRSTCTLRSVVGFMAPDGGWPATRSANVVKIPIRTNDVPGTSMSGGDVRLAVTDVLVDPVREAKFANEMTVGDCMRIHIRH